MRVRARQPARGCWRTPCWPLLVQLARASTHTMQTCLLLLLAGWLAGWLAHTVSQLMGSASSSMKRCLKLRMLLIRPDLQGGGGEGRGREGKRDRANVTADTARQY